ncbi:hypothetical protein Tco_1003336 [Tanacetum coccineum]|uniref:Uncharacterized protein n=1 Tax=Tanacetum coccineum TaxID=301880 RepID=A0ABQ5F8T1_9ASTR
MTDKVTAQGGEIKKHEVEIDLKLGLPDVEGVITNGFQYSIDVARMKEYAVTLPLCNKCKCSITMASALKVNKLKKLSLDPVTVGELKNQNHGNQARGTGARGMAMP